MSTPDITLAQHIATNVATLTYGTNIFAGPVRPPDTFVPVLAAFVQVTGGPTPDGFLGETVSWKDIGMSVFVRSAKDDWGGGRDLAALIWPVVQYASLAGGYFDVRARDPAALYLQQDTEQRHIYVVACTATIKE